MKRKNRAFTLIELMVVILILAILAALIVPNVLGRTGQAKVAKAQADIATLSSAIDQFRLDCDRYPTTQEGFGALQQQPNGANGWRGPYLKQAIPADPWTHDYQYVSPGPNGGGYQVESLGADGQPGGTGDNTDITGGSDT